MEKKELLKEKENLDFTCKYLNKKIDTMEEEIFLDKEHIQEFRRYAWENKGGMDAQELNQVRSDSEMEAKMLLDRRDYFKKLLKIKDSPYFASITVDDDNVKKNIYIGLTYLKDEKLDNLIYDWRAPICSIFYDYEIGKCSYMAPIGKIESYLYQKRQYKIEEQKLLRVIDSNINIDDDILQEVLSNSTSEKMKNIVNTIQQEQNSVIRNLKDKNLIVQGIAGSGKTSVALHRIAFLLYRIKNLSSDKILIFSPNNIFTEYISNVLPELGEENTKETTFQDYLKKMIPEYKKVEAFTDFLSRHYKSNITLKELNTYKESDNIIKDIEEFSKYYTNKISFKKGIIENKVFEYSKEELNYMFRERYSTLPMFTRIDEMALKMSENNYRGSKKKVSVYRRLLMDALEIKKDYKRILIEFYESEYFKGKIDYETIKILKSNKFINYDDALILVYLKGMLEGFYYDGDIEQIVIDEAQDYGYLQYLILSKIFKKASFTILGDVNQGINPFYQYNSLKILLNLFKGKYIELNKTYRSSEEIISYANSILNLNHVCAIRKSMNIPVIRRDNVEYLDSDISYLTNKYKSIAIIGKNESICLSLYNKLNNKYNITYIDSNSKEFNKELVIIPVYLAKGLEFDSVIVYQDDTSKYLESEKRLMYVAVTRAQHELIVYE